MTTIRYEVRRTEFHSPGHSPGNAYGPGADVISRHSSARAAVTARRRRRHSSASECQCGGAVIEIVVPRRAPGSDEDTEAWIQADRDLINAEEI